MDIFRSFRKIFFTGPVDNDIANNYLEIQDRIDKIRKILEPFLVKYHQYYTYNMDARHNYDLEKIEKIVHRIVPLFGQIWYEKNLEGESREFTSVDTKYKEYVMLCQKKLLRILNSIHHNIVFLENPNLLPKNVNLQPLVNKLEEIFEEEVQLVKLDEKVAVKVNQLIGKILANLKTENFRLNGQIVSLTYYCDESSRNLLLLQNIPLLKLAEVNMRSNIFFDSHRDKTLLGIPHYNLLVGGRNIHVIPVEYRHFLEQLKVR